MDVYDPDYPVNLLRLQEYVDSAFQAKTKINILEVGCGSLTHVRLPEEARITGLDISEKQLARNQALHERIAADAQTYNFKKEAYDLIIAWNVLEHLSEPEAAMKGMFKAVRKGGIIILTLPNIYSVKGLVTKYSPLWFHVWVYRRLFGSKIAGTDDHGPFETPFRFSVSAGSMSSMARAAGLVVDYHDMREYQMNFIRRNLAFSLAWSLMNAILKLVTFGRLNACSDFVIVLKKPEDNVGQKNDFLQTQE